MAGHMKYENSPIKHISFCDENGTLRRIKRASFCDENGVMRSVWSGASLVTYYIDNQNTMTEEVDEGSSILSPSFTPAKNGYTFLGWRENSVASSVVLSSKVATGEAMSVYAVFRKTFTNTFDGNGGTGSVSSIQSYEYYNNGNISRTSITLPGNTFARRGYTANGWRLSNPSGTPYSTGAEVTPTANTVFYAGWTSNAYSTPFLKTDNSPFGASAYNEEVDEEVWGNATSKTYDTRGCKYVEWDAHLTSGSGNAQWVKINGVQVYYQDSQNPAYVHHKFDVSAYDTITVTVDVRTAGWHLAWSRYQLRDGYPNINFTN